MTWLRLLLILCLLVGGLILSLRVPYLTKADFNGVTYFGKVTQEVPFYEGRPPAKLAHLDGQLSPWLKEDSVAMETMLDKTSLFERGAVLVVGCFLLYGLVGLFVDKHRPRGMDVAYSLGLSLGLIGATFASHLAADFYDRPFSFLWFSYFWTGGFVLSFFLTLLIRRRAGAWF
jgi:hypothetical protein